MNIAATMADSRKLLLTDSNFSTARPLVKESKVRVEENLLPLINDGVVPIIQGFIGSDSLGRTTTLGRGGSDLSATLFGAMLGVDTVEIWSDVDGVLTADPSLVPDAHDLRQGPQKHRNHGLGPGDRERPREPDGPAYPSDPAEAYEPGDTAPRRRGRRPARRG